jgi:hypothetical protein
LEKKVQGLELEPEPTSKLELETGSCLQLNLELGSWFHLLVEPESRFLKNRLEPGVNRRFWFLKGSSSRTGSKNQAWFPIWVLLIGTEID